MWWLCTRVCMRGDYVGERGIYLPCIGMDKTIVVVGCGKLKNYC